jgi:hypothetical protein
LSYDRIVSIVTQKYEGGILMIESRCGLLCSACEYREQPGCQGCTKINKPFWGDACPVKSCCEQKQLSHCGECPEFSCELLKQFAYDPKQGDGGKRIEQCKQWKEEMSNGVHA